MSFDFYTPPSDEVFDEIKKKATALWREKDNTYGYADEKVARIENIQNIQDNAWYMVSMFDMGNQAKLMMLLDEPARSAVAEMLEWSYNQ